MYELIVKLVCDVMNIRRCIKKSIAVQFKYIYTFIGCTRKAWDMVQIYIYIYWLYEKAWDMVLIYIYNILVVQERVGIWFKYIYIHILVVQRGLGIWFKYIYIYTYIA